jgi:outer membrane protein assembly factor BamE (lipoprotein component of BamABCDE complex)
MRRIAMVLLLAAAGCGNPGKANSLNKVEAGMSKAEVKAILGTPKTTSVIDGADLWKYDLATTRQRWVTGGADDYLVKFQDGKVVGYGKEEEFYPAQNVKVEIKKKKR